MHNTVFQADKKLKNPLTPILVLFEAQHARQTLLTACLTNVLLHK